MIMIKHLSIHFHSRKVECKCTKCKLQKATSNY